MKSILVTSSAIALSALATAQPVMVKDIVVGSQSPIRSSGFFEKLYGNNGLLYFTCDTSQFGNLEQVWVSDGTAAGTQQISNHDQLSEGFNAAGGSVYYGATDNNQGGLWKTNGTATGTSLVKSLVAAYTGPRFGIELNGKLYFTAEETGNSGAEFHESDGTSAGTKLVANLEPLGNYGSNPVNYAKSGNYLIFKTNTWTNATKLYGSDGSAAGTVDLGLGSANAFGYTLEHNGSLYFVLNDNNNTKSFYKKGPTTQASRQAFILGMNAFGIIGNKVLHSAFASTGGNELYAMDTMLANDALLKDINPTGWSLPNNFQMAGNFLYFICDDGSHGWEVWKTDGTAAGTVLVKDIFAGATSSMPSRFLEMNGKLYFTAEDSLHGRELYVLDASNDSVTMYDINPGMASSMGPYQNNYPFGYTNGQVFFIADDGTHGSELWKTGTPTNPVGIFENNQQNTVEIFPNPANGKISIRTVERTTSGMISIFDQTGKLVIEHILKNVESEINIATLNAGIYY